MSSGKKMAGAGGEKRRLNSRELSPDFRRKQKYFFLASFLLIIILSAAVMLQFINAILTGAILAYLSFPLFKWFRKKLKSGPVAGLITVAVVVLIIIVPLIFTLNILSREAYSFYLFAREAADGTILEPGCSSKDTVYCSIVSGMESIVSESDITFYIGDALKKGTLFLVDASSNFIFSIPGRLFELFLALFIMYYLLQDGPGLIESLWEFIPFRRSQERQLQDKIESVAYAVVYGHLLTASVQGIIGGIGFFIFGISSPVVWGILIAIGGLIPLVGTSIVWGPASVYLVIKGIISSSWVLAGKGLGLFLYGLFIVGTVDNFLKPKLISGRANVHPALILLGLLGGLKLFGIVGVIYGPLILALLVTFMDIYRRDFEF